MTATFATDLTPSSDTGFIVELTASEAEVNSFIGDLGRQAELLEVVRSGAPLLTIVPRDVGMEIDLLVPSSAIGFLERDQLVWLRYSAFPYQKYGQFSGTIIDVGRAALSIRGGSPPGRPRRADHRGCEKQSEPTSGAAGVFNRA